LIEHPVSSIAARTDRLNVLLASIEHTGDLVTDDVIVPGVISPLKVTRPTNTDLLLDQIVNDPEQNLPYWAELWPSGIALAAAVACQPDIVTGKRCLELGSGIGITAAVAVAAGAHLLASDYAEESLTLTRITSLQHCGTEPDILRMNWRDPRDQERLLEEGPFAVVLAADVLYERRDIEPLLDLLDRTVAPDGMLWLAHPGRPPARVFLERAKERGWAGSTTEFSGPWPDPNDELVVAYVHALRRETGINP
jgi:predicted nicotinamide N-methyase